MDKDFCVEFVDQCGEVFITHPSIQSAKEHLAELPQIPNARQNLKQLGVEVLNIVVKLDSSVGVCVGQIELGEKIVIKIDETWRDDFLQWFGVGARMDSKMDCHASTRALARNNKKTGFWKTLKMWLLKPTAKDSRICDEKSLLCEHSQGRALGVRNRRECEAIKDLSRKAESTSKV